LERARGLGKGLWYEDGDKVDIGRGRRGFGTLDAFAGKGMASSFFSAVLKDWANEGKVFLMAKKWQGRKETTRFPLISNDHSNLVHGEKYDLSDFVSTPLPCAQRKPFLLKTQTGGEAIPSFLEAHWKTK